MLSWARAYGLSTLSLRYFNIFGPRQPADSPYSGVIPIFAKKLFQSAPSIFIGCLKCVEIHGHNAGVVFGHEVGNDFGDLRLLRRGRKLLDGAVIVMSDPQAVQEIAEQLAVRSDEPDLQDVSCDVRVATPAQPFANPSVALGPGLSFKEDRADFVLLAKGCHRGFEEIGLLFCEVGE